MGLGSLPSCSAPDKVVRPFWWCTSFVADFGRNGGPGAAVALAETFNGLMSIPGT